MRNPECKIDNEHCCGVIMGSSGYRGWSDEGLLASSLMNYPDSMLYKEAERRGLVKDKCTCVFTIPVCSAVEDHHRRMKEEN